MNYFGFDTGKKNKYRNMFRMTTLISFSKKNEQRVMQNYKKTLPYERGKC